MSDIIKLAIKESGGICSLAAALGIRHNSIYGWTQIPAERVRAVSEKSGIAPHILRPDIFEPSQPEALSNENS